jgi:PAS domain S-box-containing protein
MESINNKPSLYARSLIEAILDPIVTTCIEGKITDANMAFSVVTGIERTELIGTDFSQYFTNPQKAKDGLQEILAKRFVVDFTLTIKHTNGKLSDILLNATLNKNEDESLKGVFAVTRNAEKANVNQVLLSNKQNRTYPNQDTENHSAEIVKINMPPSPSKH